MEGLWAKWADISVHVGKLLEGRGEKGKEYGQRMGLGANMMTLEHRVLLGMMHDALFTNLTPFQVNRANPQK